MVILKDFYKKQLLIYTKNTSLVEFCWQEIEDAYQESSRFYHNLNHLFHIWNLLLPLKNQLNSPIAIWMALFYHDVVYEPTKKNNEEQSARLAEARLGALKLSNNVIEKCVEIILATKGHDSHKDQDINYFTDADLAILGSNRHEYVEYTAQIRNEYRIYDDVTYSSGRQKVLKHFLAMPRIYKTAYFYDNFEKQSRLNLIKELESFM